MTQSRPHTLFSFGTLLDERVQTALFGGAVPSSPASLTGYAARPLTITDESVIAASGLDVHLTLGRKYGAVVEGAVLHLTDQDLAAADAYEVDDYARRRVLLTSGESAWAYLDAKPLRSAARIVIVGDSIAYGRCDPQGGWAARLAATHIAGNEAEHRVFNLAIPGSTLADVSEQTPAVLAPRLPDTVLVAAGINDSALPLAMPETPRDGLAHIADSLGSLAATALSHNARLVVVGPAWVDEERTRDYEGLHFTRARALALRESVRAWCDENHVDYLDMWEPLRERTELLVDGVHPTPEGHQVLHRHLDALGR
ncbi:GDSL-like Lipase/Acylhydrolase [Streptomyces netropsis]|uniref:Lysophospholipase L1-like esterase n=1 Tax=Streptomyces syringium TaxID=76729 RepID=A0ABS4YAI2_9ACTN|nr:GDSL-type esterase/lipase family protein [Streptomyces syringium]MBP2405751.1 lysophospholipase L1-like esterase [Streptomyces syringium]SPE64328.1 GDSL-like Lipase/Acylhydrolase [Streptomyces netropsis]